MTGWKQINLSAEKKRREKAIHHKPIVRTKEEIDRQIAAFPGAFIDDDELIVRYNLKGATPQLCECGSMVAFVTVNQRAIPCNSDGTEHKH